MKKRQKTPFTDAMKKRRRERTRSELLDGLFEGAVELGFMLICFLAGAGVFALFGATLPNDGELVALVGMLVVIALVALIGAGVACIYFLTRNDKSPSKDKRSAKDSTAAKRSIPNLQALYDAVKESVPTAVLDGFTLRIEYREESMTFVQKDRGVFIARIGEAVIGTLDGWEAHRLATEFAHDDGTGQIFIRDTWMCAMSGGVIEYRDYFDRPHTLALIDLTPLDGCIGEASDRSREVTLYTRGASVVIGFSALYSRRGVISGGKRQRYNKFKILISGSGYRLGAAPKKAGKGK